MLRSHGVVLGRFSTVKLAESLAIALNPPLLSFHPLRDFPVPNWAWVFRLFLSWWNVV